MEFTYDLDNPLKAESVNLTRGLINLKIPKGTRINNLKLIILSKHFGQKKNYLNSNLYLLFGPHFICDINNINIMLYNPMTKIYTNDRKIIQNILEYMCFKKIKLVTVNNDLMYYVIPEHSEFSIVLGYSNYLDIYNNKHIEQILFHQYSQFEASIINFSKCLRAIQKSVPIDVNNIILPVIFFNKSEKENILLFSEFRKFLIEIILKFKIISLELKTNYYNKDFIIFFIEENLDLIRKFQHIFLSFEFTIGSDKDEIQKIFKNVIFKFKLENVTFALHTSFTNINIKTKLNDMFDYYDSVQLDKNYLSNILQKIHLLKKLNIKKNFIKHLFLKQIYSDNYKDYIFIKGNFDFSVELIKNKKLVPMELSKTNALIYKN